MMTVRFPNGQAIQYNDANFVTRNERYSDLLTRKNGDWVAQVPHDCLIEIVPACRVYDGLHQEHDQAVLTELESLRKEIRKLRLKK